MEDKAIFSSGISINKVFKHTSESILLLQVENNELANQNWPE